MNRKKIICVTLVILIAISSLIFGVGIIGGNKKQKVMLQFVVMEYVKFQQKTKTEIRYMQFHHLLDITTWR